MSQMEAARLLAVDAESEGQRLDNFLLRHLKGVPKTHVYRIIRSGEVRVNKGRAAADTRVAAGDRVRVAQGGASAVLPARLDAGRALPRGDPGGIPGDFREARAVLRLGEPGRYRDERLAARALGGDGKSAPQGGRRRTIRSDEASR